MGLRLTFHDGFRVPGSGCVVNHVSSDKSHESIHQAIAWMGLLLGLCGLAPMAHNHEWQNMSSPKPQRSKLFGHLRTKYQYHDCLMGHTNSSTKSDSRYGGRSTLFAPRSSLTCLLFGGGSHGVDPDTWDSRLKPLQSVKGIWAQSAALQYIHSKS